jgi:hypothetical protein
LLKTIDKATAQGKRFSTIGRRTEDLKTAKVGSASLFEKPRSRARQIPRFSDIMDDNDSYAYNADCDSSAYNAMRNRC